VRRRGRPRKKGWLDDVEDDLRKAGVKCWRILVKVMDMTEWRKIYQAAKVLQQL
jgi:hypothetical protein